MTMHSGMAGLRRAAAHWIGAGLLLLCGLTSSSAAGPRFDGARAYRDLKQQCAFGPRVPNTAAHEKTAAWLAAQLKPLAASVTQQRFVVRRQGKELRLSNLIATINPKGRPRVLLCAHWDSRPTADHDPDPAKRSHPVPGANDGASGVAVLLEVARALKAHPPKQQVTLVLFDGEDYGPGADMMFLGSRYFAEHFSGSAPEWAVLLDMVGDRDLRLPKEAYSRQYAPAVVARVWGAAARAQAPAFVQEQGQPIMDDHLPLLQQGISCIDVIDFTYPSWHTTADTPEKCSAESLGQVGRTLLAALEGP